MTPYGESKVLAERDIRPLADDDFTPRLPAQRDRLRPLAAPARRPRRPQPARAPRTRSARSGWRATARRGARSATSRTSRAPFLAALEAPRETVHNEAFNIGRDEDNLLIRDLALMVEETVPGQHGDVRRRRRARTSAPTASRSRRSRPSCPASSRSGRCRRASSEVYEAYKTRGLDARRLPVLALPAHQAGARAQGRRPHRRRPALARRPCPPAPGLASRRMSSKDTPAEEIPVVILAGGMGTRLREDTESVPKPLRRDRRQADPLAHHEALRPSRPPALRPLPGLQELADQGVLPPLPRARLATSRSRSATTTASTFHNQPRRRELGGDLRRDRA